MGGRSVGRLHVVQYTNVLLRVMEFHSFLALRWIVWVYLHSRSGSVSSSQAHGDVMGPPRRM